MEDIDLPPIHEAPPQSGSLSMDEYLEFVTFNLKYAFDRKAFEERKQALTVNVPFSL